MTKKDSPPMPRGSCPRLDPLQVEGPAGTPGARTTLRRATLVRAGKKKKKIGSGNQLMMDANQDSGDAVLEAIKDATGKGRKRKKEN